MLIKRRSEVSHYIIKPCPKCSSEDITLYGVNFVQIQCNLCGHAGMAYSFGTRCEMYDHAIRDWELANYSSDVDLKQYKLDKVKALFNLK